MKHIRRILSLFFIMTLANSVLSCVYLNIPVWQKVLLVSVLALIYIALNIAPFIKRSISVRLQILMGGYELIVSALLGIIIQTVFTIYLCMHFSADSLSRLVLAGNDAIALLLMMIMIVNGFIRFIFTSTQLKLFWKCILLFVWWIPVVNLLVLIKLCHVVRLEYQIELSKQELDDVRKESEICKTKYPIVLVHGVFFRDWQIFNYWGRIPQELKKNGAEIFYGKQQSAAAVADSAEELKQRILDIIEETGCRKVNIIAHSKGGLDSRFAISCLGMDTYVASLTTINTPHRGCLWVEELMKKIPDKFVKGLTRKYNAVFSKLGDPHPDFYPALCDLTAKNCCELNKKMPDKSGVYYQSVMSKMSRMFSDGFPLFVSYYFARKSEGENDGLVSVKSAVWGNYLGTLSVPQRRGLSHGDLIDLKRENIEGFDVREYYVGLVKDLKNRGM